MSASFYAARPFDAAACRKTLFAALLDAARRFGRKKPILEDPDRAPLSYARLVLAALVLGRRLIADTERGERVGVLLPNVNGVVITFFGLNAYGRVPAMLNFTAGARNLRSACETAGIRKIVTARRFVDQAKLDDEIAAMEEGGGRETIYLEDVRKSLTSFDKAFGVLSLLFAGLVHKRYALGPDDPGIVLFTSGTEGKPKGVVLSNANLVSNAMQVMAHAGDNLRPDDIFFNPLPVFHSFGMTAGVLTSVLNGMKTVLYPSPLHYKQVPKLIGETRATFLLATDTFLQGYARAAAPDDLKSVRFVVAGAERVKDETRAMWSRTGTVILEGYGATECSPVIAVNLPETNRPGSAGQLLPGIEARLDPVEGIEGGGRLSVKGPNVMKGYLFAEPPGEIVPPKDGWHETGDIVTIDEESFVTIKGRATRFAKIGGEMISLAAVETMLGELWPSANHVVVALPDTRKGEQLVLLTEKPDADKTELLNFAHEKGFSELWVPRAIMVVPMIPVLGNGKVDFGTAVEMAKRMRSLL